MSATLPTVSIIVPVMNVRGSDDRGPRRARVIAACGPGQRFVLRGFRFVDDRQHRRDVEQYRHGLGERSPHRRHPPAPQLRQGDRAPDAVSPNIDDIVVTMDADLQDDPHELPRFVAAIEAGSDVVSGWKRVRHDPAGKTLPSKVFNSITARVSGIPLHDFNCGYKAYRREVFDAVHLYGELHRFVPVLAHAYGYRISEIEVTHHPRRFGHSKYGARRFMRGLLDLFSVVTVTRYARKPGHLFGAGGLLLGAVGTLILAWLSIEWLFGASIGRRPLLQLGVLLVLVGVQLLMFGLLAELMISRDREALPSALVRERIDATRPPSAG